MCEGSKSFVMITKDNINYIRSTFFKEDARFFVDRYDEFYHYLQEKGLSIAKSDIDSSNITPCNTATSDTVAPNTIAPNATAPNATAPNAIAHDATAHDATAHDTDVHDINECSAVARCFSLHDSGSRSIDNGLVDNNYIKSSLIDSTQRSIDYIITELKQLGVQVRNDGNSIRWGEISPGCEGCKTSVGAHTFVISLMCNRDCYFCTNRAQSDSEASSLNDIRKEYIDITSAGTLHTVGITGGEPLLFIDECIEFVRAVKASNRETDVRIYTNGDLATATNVKKLADARVNELRFGLKVDDDGSIFQDALENLREAVPLIDRVVVEMPVPPNGLEYMKKLVDKLEAWGVHSINILEFLYPWTQEEDYINKGYALKDTPYKVLYNYHYPGGIPIDKSEIECVKLLKYIATSNYRLGAHYCSLENKLYYQMWNQNNALSLNSVEYFSPNDFFIKVAKVYGADVSQVKRIFNRNNITYKDNDTSLSFHVSAIQLLAKQPLPLEVGIAYLMHESGRLEEVALAYTTSDRFRLSDI